MAKTPSFITEIPLIVTPLDASILNKRFEAARQVYNACLGEGLRRMRVMRDSKEWQRARTLPVGKERTKAFKILDERYGFRKWDVSPITQKMNNESYLGDHLDSQTMVAMSTRAFTWIEQYIFDPERGLPKFKRYGTMNSVESPSNRQGIMWKADRVVWNSGHRGIKLILPAIIDPENKVMTHGLSCRVKQTRIIRRVFNGKTKFFAQLVNEGIPLQRFEMGQGITGLDLGPSTIAIVEPDKADLLLFCEKLVFSQKEIVRLQRKRERQARANNPQNYEKDRWVHPVGQKPRLKLGPVKKGSKCWKKSKSQKKTEARLTDMQRRLAAHRKSLHGQLVNRIFQSCDTVKLEKIQYKTWQKLWGKSIGKRAPGMFVQKLRTRMADGEGVVDEFPTQTTALSQTCHGCGAKVKKGLNVRWHRCECGVIAQRDLYSAFLATCVEEGRLNGLLAQEKWAEMEHILQTAIDDVRARANGTPLPSSFGINLIQRDKVGTGL